MSKRQSNRFALGFLLGAAAGAATGLLVSARRDRATRERLRISLQRSAAQLPDLLEDVGQVVQSRAVQLSEQARDRWEETIDRLREAIATGIAATAEPIATDPTSGEPSDADSNADSKAAATPRQLAYRRLAASASPSGDRERP
jgi:gas vesicle protein